jgi:hypothetical protein
MIEINDINGHLISVDEILFDNLADHRLIPSFGGYHYEIYQLASVILRKRPLDDVEGFDVFYWGSRQLLVDLRFTDEIVNGDQQYSQMVSLTTLRLFLDRLNEDTTHIFVMGIHNAYDSIKSYLDDDKIIDLLPRISIEPNRFLIRTSISDVLMIITRCWSEDIVKSSAMICLFLALRKTRIGMIPMTIHPLILSSFESFYLKHFPNRTDVLQQAINDVIQICMLAQM